MNRDIEAGEVTPLLSSKKEIERPWLEEFEAPPVGGFPGNSAFRGQVFLALRCAFFACVLASMIWFPSTQLFVTKGFAKYFPLSVLVIFFTVSPIFGTIMCNASAVILGTFFAVANIYILQIFFPQGVRPGDGALAAASIVGWLDLASFTFVFVVLDVRVGVRMFALAYNAGFMLSFLNPEDIAPISTGFLMHPNCTAATCAKVTCIACLLALLANLLPFPFRFAFADMQANSKRVSAYVAKDFIASVQYYAQEKPYYAVVDRQMACTELTETQAQAAVVSISSAWYEGFDLGGLGPLRHLHKKHGTLTAEILEVAKAVKVTIKTEHFGERHLLVMKRIGGACSRLAESAGELLVTATRVVTDGGASAAGKVAARELEDRETLVREDVKSLAKVFDTTRRSWTPICKEVMNESFFVFALSAYARKVVEFSEMVRCEPPLCGPTFSQTLLNGFRSTFTLDRVGDGHYANAARSWTAIMLSIAYCVIFDDYKWVCVCTVVILQSLRMGPDVPSFLNAVTGVAIASIMSTVIFSSACNSLFGDWLLPSMAFLYWWLMLYIYFSGCSSSLIGIFGASLSAFMLVEPCPGPEVVTWTTEAMRLGICFRRFMIGVLILFSVEYFFRKDSFAKCASEALNKAMLDLEHALKLALDNRNPSEALASAASLLVDARMCAKAAVQEPRGWRCKWKHDLLMEVAYLADMMRIQVTMMRQAMLGTNGKSSGVTEVLSRVSAFAAIKHDLENLTIGARDVTYKLMEHDWGEFTGIDESKVKSPRTMGLEGVDDAILDTNQLDIVDFTSRPILTLENDLLCRMSVMFVMLGHVMQCSGSILEACRRES